MTNLILIQIIASVVTSQTVNTLYLKCNFQYNPHNWSRVYTLPPTKFKT